MSPQHAAVADLYRQESSNLRRQLLRKLNGDLDQAEDVMQDAYIRMLCVPAEHATLRNPKAFLFTVASNLAIDTVRRGRRTQRLFATALDAEIVLDGEQFDIVAPQCATDDAVGAQLRLEHVLRVLGELPAKCRHAFMLHKCGELSHSEVAQRMGVTVSMVEKHVSRALQHLREHHELLDS